MTRISLMTGRQHFKINILLFLLCFVTGFSCYGQFLSNVFSKKKAPHNGWNTVELPIDKIQLIPQIGDYISSLRAEEMGGRIIGSKGAERAGRYILQQMNKSGLKPFDRHFIHTFNFFKISNLNSKSGLTIGRNKISFPSEGFLMPFSAFKQMEGYVMPGGRRLGQPWIIPLYDGNTTTPWNKLAYKKALNAQKRGATAVLLYNDKPSIHILSSKTTSSFPKLNIPVLLIKNKAYRKKIKPISVITPMSLKLQSTKEYGVAANIIGTINNGAPQSVVICAHFDGYPIAKNSSKPNDDDVAAVASLLALGHLVNKSKLREYNYIFIALSGGTKESLGVKALFNNNVIKGKEIAYVLDLDRIAFSKQPKQIYINGLNSSYGWLSLFKNINNGWQVIADDYSVDTNNYTIFLQHHIPTLSLSGYKHENSSLEKNEINSVSPSEVVYRVTKLAYKMIYFMNHQKKPVFILKKRRMTIQREIKAIVQQSHIKQKREAVKPTPSVTKTKTKPKSNPKSSSSKGPVVNVEKTRQQNQKPGLSNTPKIELLNPIGLVMDTTFSGYGVKVLKVKKGEKADRAGLKSGDIIMIVGNTKINNEQDYIIALNNLSPGEQVKLRVKRGKTVQNFILVNI